MESFTHPWRRTNETKKLNAKYVEMEKTRRKKSTRTANTQKKTEHNSEAKQNEKR